MIALDHALVLVRSLDEAAAAYRRLGFTLTPEGRHSGLGTANHTIMLERDYLELLAVVEPGPANARWSEAVARREGLSTLVLATGDAVGLAATLRSRGIATGEPIRFGRPVARATIALPVEQARTSQSPRHPAAARPDEARFTVCFPDAAASPAFPIFFCQHHTPDLVWQRPYQSHANGARGIRGVIVTHPEPHGVAPAYERLLGAARVHPRPGGITVQLGSTAVWIVTPRWAAARAKTEVPGHGALGLTVGVASLATARATLSASGVQARPFGNRSILVDGEYTHGLLLELLED